MSEMLLFRLPRKQKDALKSACALEHKSMTRLMGELVDRYLSEVKEAKKLAS